MDKRPFLINTKLYKVLGKISRPFYQLHIFTNLLDWMAENGKLDSNDFHTKNTSYKKRFQLHEKLIAEYGLDTKVIDYFEFGVAKGDMIKYWLSKNTNPLSKFVGFDSFEGLPEGWESKEKGHFNTQGNFPSTDDERVDFVKGWFQDTVNLGLRDRRFSEQSVYHLDADLFSSTLYVLFTLHPYLKKGDILIFDEFTSAEHEFLALEIFKECQGRPWSYRSIGGINNFRQCAFIIE
jgi:hypothetical protein